MKHHRHHHHPRRSRRPGETHFPNILNGKRVLIFETIILLPARSFSLTMIYDITAHHNGECMHAEYVVMATPNCYHCIVIFGRESEALTTAKLLFMLFITRLVAKMHCMQMTMMMMWFKAMTA